MSSKEELMELEEDMIESDEGSPVADASADSMRILEALLFASDELMTAARLKSILPDNPDARVIRKMVDKLNVQLQKERHPFEIVEIGGGYQFRTVSFYHTWVRQIFKEKASKKLSIQALECLAIIAYKQPISKAEIEAIRGVVSDGAMKTLLEKKLVTMTGRSDKPGRPLLYGTTQEFLRYFGLNKIVDLPKIEEFEAIAREKMEELSIEELQKPENELDEEKLANGQVSSGTSSESEVAIPESTAVFEVSADLGKDTQDKTNESSVSEPLQEIKSDSEDEKELDEVDFESKSQTEEEIVVENDQVENQKTDSLEEFEPMEEEFEIKPEIDANKTFEEEQEAEIDFEVSPKIEEEQFDEEILENKSESFNHHETETEYDVKAKTSEDKDEEELFEIPVSLPEQDKKETFTEASSKKDDEDEADLESLK